MIKIDDVQRVDGRVVRVTASFGDIEVTFILPEDGEFPKEVSRLRYGAYILNRDALWIPPREYRELAIKVNKIFSEVRPVKSHSPRKKGTKVSKKRNQEVLQWKLF